MSEPARLSHVSSAVVSVRPERRDAVVRLLRELPDTEVPASAGAKIVVVFEAANSGVIADRLTRIALIDGVISANMVFEHVELEHVELEHVELEHLELPTNSGA